MTDKGEKIVLGREAETILANEAFTKSVLALRKQWFAELMAEPPGTLRSAALHAMLQALEKIPEQLGVFINDSTMAQRSK